MICFHRTSAEHPEDIWMQDPHRGGGTHITGVTQRGKKSLAECGAPE